MKSKNIVNDVALNSIFNEQCPYEGSYFMSDEQWAVSSNTWAMSNNIWAINPNLVKTHGFRVYNQSFDKLIAYF
jgi:hypothetical protein